MKELLLEILATSRRNKLRTALTGFAVAWGIFMLIFLLGAGNGLINAQLGNRDRFMSSSMMVGGGVTSKPYDGLKEGRPLQIDNADIAATGLRHAANLTSSGGIVTQSGMTVQLGDEYYVTEISGVAPGYAPIEKVEMAQGRFVNTIDMRERRKIAVIDSENARLLGHGDAASVVGRHVRINGSAFLVAGIYKADRTRSKNPVYAPISTVQAIYKRGDKADEMLLSFHGLHTEEQGEQFERAVRATLNSRHRAAPDDSESFWIWNRFTQSLQMDAGIGIIRTALWVIGLLTLVSGIVGVSNIMLITVKERTREFGIRKAIGASPGAIVRLILAESVLITVAFGYIGMLLGIAANEWMKVCSADTVVRTDFFEMQTFLNPTVGLSTCLAALAILVAAGTLAGLIPAHKAARIRPIEALRAD